MSVSIEDVIIGAGYDLSDVDDATWLLSQDSEWGELIDKANNTVELYSCYEDFVENLEEIGSRDIPSFEEWKKSNEE